MTSWVPCPAPGPAGFDLDEAVLLSPDVLDWDRGRWTSRATGTPWRESLWRTGTGEHVVGLDSGGEGSSGLDADHWRWLSTGLAEDWLRSQGLHELADGAFGTVLGRPPVLLTVALGPAHRAELEQVCADDDLSTERVLALALDHFLRARCPEVAAASWWPAGVERDLRPSGLGTVRPVVADLRAGTLEP